MGKYSLIVISGFIVTFGWVQGNLNRVRNELANTLVGFYDRTMARNIANSGARVALQKLVEDATWRTGWTNAGLFGGFSSTTIVDSAADTSLMRREIRVVASGAFGAAEDTAVVLWRRTAFSEYAYFTNQEPEIYFITSDTLTGPVHTNGTIHIAGNPVFEGRVTSPNPWVGYGSPEFQDGADFNHPAVHLPISLTDLINAAQNGGVVANPPTGTSLWLDFQANGTVRYVILNNGTSPSGGTSWSTFDLSTINGVIGCTKDVHVMGTLNGQITLGSNQNIYIEDDLRYADDPRQTRSDDLLGLVSRQQIIVAQNAANNTNCEIHASLLALDKFTVQNYNQGSPRGTLTILGGVVQETRGAVGTFGGGGIQTGYHKKYQYDDRLAEMVPPFYPITGENTGGSTYAPGKVLAWYE